MRTLTSLAIVSLLVCSSARAQDVLALDLDAGSFSEMVAISPLWPAGGPNLGSFPADPALPSLAPPVTSGSGYVSAGAVSANCLTGRIWFTNGAWLAATPHSGASSTAPAVAPFNPPPGLGLVTGMALNPVSNIMWYTDGFGLLGATPIVGATPFAPTIPLTWATSALTGLDWDILTGTLWATDRTGKLYNFLSDGTLLSTLPSAWVLPTPVTGVAIDKTGNFVPGLTERPIYQVASGVVREFHSGTAAPFANNPVGLSMLAAGQLRGPACACAAGFAPQIEFDGHTTSGNSGFAIRWEGLPAGAPVLGAVDIVFNPLAPAFGSSGCVIGLDLLSQTLILLPLQYAGVAGTFTQPASLAGILPGLGFYAQFVTPCSTDSSGLIASPLVGIHVSAP